MEYVQIPGTDLSVSRIALGTWAIGGWMWGGTEKRRSIDTILAALKRDVNLIDTAPIYGFGTSEKIVGEAIAEHGRRKDVVLSTKVTLEWSDDGAVFRNGSRDRIMKEVEDSLERLRTDYIDIYFVHWPDCTRPIAETARAMRELYDQGTIKAVGVSNYTQDQMDRFRAECPIHLCQPPYNIYERAIELDIKPYCERNQIALMAYGALCRGLLTGKISAETEFEGDDLRKVDPKFRPPRFDSYLRATKALEKLAKRNYGASLLAFSVRWVLEKGVPVATWGARTPAQLDPLDEVFGWSMDAATLSRVESILAEHIAHPVGPEFMAPPTGRGT